MKMISLDKIYPNPDQPRKFFHPGKLEELAQSIKESGLLEPLIVVKREDRYMIVAGERRWRACKIASVKEVPARILEADDRTIAELALLENLQREDLNVIEEAHAYQNLVNMGISHEEIARKMGLKRVWQIQERLDILRLTPVLQDYTIKGILGPMQAWELSRLPQIEQGPMFDKVASGKLNTCSKLRIAINALLCVKEQISFIPEPTEKERQVNNKYDAMIENIVHFLNQAFSKDDMKVLSQVLTPEAKQNIEKIDMIVWHLNRIKRALMLADSTKEAVEQVALSI